jgi:uncharacterized protein YjbI with pentapeptide repeats
VNAIVLAISWGIIRLKHKLILPSLMSQQDNSNSKENTFQSNTTLGDKTAPKLPDDKSEKRVEIDEKDQKTQDNIDTVLMPGKSIFTERRSFFFEDLCQRTDSTIELFGWNPPDVNICQDSKEWDAPDLTSTENQTEGKNNEVLTREKSDSENYTKDRGKESNTTSVIMPFLAIVITLGCAVMTILRDQQKSIDERFLKTIELIGHSDPNVRSGAIIALKQVFQDSPNKKQESVELLANLVRINSPFFAKRSSVKVVPSDVAMALKVIKEADRKAKNRTPIDLPYIDLLSTVHKIKEKEPINLSHVNLFSIAQEVKEEEPINLSHVNLFNIDFSKGNLENISFNHSSLREADLKNAKLKGAYFKSALLISTNMKNADLKGSHLEEANLGNANLEGSHLEEATFDKKYLKQIKRACNWHLAHYDPEIEDDLGITNMEDKKLDESPRCKHFSP